MINIYGIPNCDTVRKSLKWLETQQMSYEFHDFKTMKLTKTTLKKWTSALPWQRVLNNKSTTWRELSTDAKAEITNEAAAIALLQNHASAIKRPVVEWPDGSITIGFNELVWSKIVSQLK